MYNTVESIENCSSLLPFVSYDVHAISVIYVRILVPSTNSISNNIQYISCNSNTTGATIAAGTVYPSGTSALIP